MAVNHNGEYVLPGRHRPMSDYDCLPAKVREIIRNAPFNLNISDAGREQIARGEEDDLVAELPALIQNALVSSCRETYGPDHPQAQ